MKGKREERLASQFREEIYAVISTSLRNRYPQLSAIISVTGADVAPDLKNAKVYISIYDPDGERKQASFEIIQQSAGFIRHELSKVLHLRTVPELHILPDSSMEYGEKIDRILKNLENTENTENTDNTEKDD